MQLRAMNISNHPPNERRIVPIIHATIYPTALKRNVYQRAVAQCI
jgi:hypothetical protein